MTDENKIADEKTATAIETAIKVLKETLHGGNTVPCWDIAEAMIALERHPQRLQMTSCGPVLEPLNQPLLKGATDDYNDMGRTLRACDRAHAIDDGR